MKSNVLRLPGAVKVGIVADVLVPTTFQIFGFEHHTVAHLVELNKAFINTEAIISRNRFFTSIEIRSGYWATWSTVFGRTLSVPHTGLLYAQSLTDYGCTYQGGNSKLSFSFLNRNGCQACA